MGKPANETATPYFETAQYPFLLTRSLGATLRKDLGNPLGNQKESFDTLCIASPGPLSLWVGGTFVGEGR